MREREDGFVSAIQILCEEWRGGLLSLPEAKKSSVQEIRLRVGKPLALTDGSTTLFWGKDGKLHLFNASSIHKKVVYEPMTLQQYMSQHPTQLGIRVIRINGK